MFYKSYLLNRGNGSHTLGMLESKCSISRLMFLLP